MSDKEDFDKEDDEDFPSISQAQRDAVTEALGYEIDDASIQEAVELFSDQLDLTVINELHEREIVFKAAGGLGVELADEIDQLRIVIAVRKVEPTWYDPTITTS